MECEHLFILFVEPSIWLDTDLVLVDTRLHPDDDKDQDCIWEQEVHKSLAYMVLEWVCKELGWDGMVLEWDYKVLESDDMGPW